MNRAIFAAVLMLCGAAVAGDFVYTHGSDVVVITMAACELSLPQKDVMMAAHAHIGGHDFAACWAPVNKDFLVVFYEDGDQGSIPFAALRPLTDI